MKKEKAQAIKPQLPAGFKAIARRGGSWPQQDAKPGEVLEGKLVKFDEVQSKYKNKKTKKFEMQKTAIVETKSGNVTIYENAALSGVFDVKPGRQIYIQYLGSRKVKGYSKPFRDFIVGWK
jgi:hypothetical protein